MSVIFKEIISKAKVRNKDISGITKIILSLENSMDYHSHCIAIGFDYDDVPEEVYVIPEVREWVKCVMEKHPYFLYYCEKDIFNTDQVVLLCMCDIASVFFEGEYISQDEYMKKYGDLSADIPVKIETNGIGDVLKSSLDAILDYGKSKNIESQTTAAAYGILHKWGKKLSINK